LILRDIYLRIKACEALDGCASPKRPHATSNCQDRNGLAHTEPAAFTRRGWKKALGLLENRPLPGRTRTAESAANQNLEWPIPGPRRYLRVHLQTPLGRIHHRHTDGTARGANHRLRRSPFSKPNSILSLATRCTWKFAPDCGGSSHSDGTQRHPHGAGRRVRSYERGEIANGCGAWSRNC